MASLKTSVTLNAALLEEARQHGVNVSGACSEGLEAAVKKARWAAWRAEHSEATAAYNKFVEENGLLLAEYRMF